MHKYLVSLAIAAQALCFTPVLANPFAKLTPIVSKKATVWAVKVTNTLDDELQLTFLNLFALNSENSINAFIKCAEYIESQPDMLTLYQLLGSDIMEIIKKYAEEIQEKITLKKNISDDEKEVLWQKLETKIQELVGYINTIYYQTLYSHMAKRSGSSAMFMFNENGLIQKDKRDKTLPQPL